MDVLNVNNMTKTVPPGITKKIIIIINNYYNYIINITSLLVLNIYILEYVSEILIL